MSNSCTLSQHSCDAWLLEDVCIEKLWYLLRGLSKKKKLGSARRADCITQLRITQSKSVCMFFFKNKTSISSGMHLYMRIRTRYSYTCNFDNIEKTKCTKEQALTHILEILLSGAFAKLWTRRVRKTVNTHSTIGLNNSAGCDRKTVVSHFFVVVESFLGSAG